jgi:hypothetical protein
MPFLPGLDIANQAGLFALLSLVLLLLTHLIRPKPRELEIPSLMFFLKNKTASRLFAFLHRILRDPLIILQALAIACLALILAQPFFLTLHRTEGHVVLVLDSSASMQAEDGGMTRFERAVDEGRERLGRKTAIILAKATPEVGLKEAGSGQARSFLAHAKPAATPSHIGEAMVLAGDFVRGSGRVVVLSDFRNTGGIEPSSAAKALEAKGIPVDLVSVVRESPDNIGFIDFVLEADDGKAFIKNFGTSPKDVTLRIGDERITKSLAPRATEAVAVPLTSGVAAVELELQDALAIDNTLHLSLPPTEPVRVLLVTSNASVFLAQALQATGEVNLTIAEPPVVPTTGFDIVILHRINPGQLLAGTMRDLRLQVRKGASAVVLAWRNMSGLDFAGLLPVELGEQGTGGQVSIAQQSRFTKDLDFGVLREHIDARPASGALTLATVQNSTVLALAPEDAGSTAYVGFLEDAGDLPFSTAYPIFWLELIRHLAGRQDARELNARTAETLILDQETDITLPDGSREESATLALEQAGQYMLPDRKVAVNLLNARESDINALVTDGPAGAAALKDAVPQEESLNPWLLLLAAAFLLIELYLLKRRGEV